MTRSYLNAVDAQLGQLTKEYEDWQQTQGLDLGSADEFLFEDTDRQGTPLTKVHHDWLYDFVLRWEAVAKGA
jgi:hypothetical protein